MLYFDVFSIYKYNKCLRFVKVLLLVELSKTTNMPYISKINGQIFFDKEWIIELELYKTMT